MDYFNGAVTFTFALFAVGFGFTEHVIKLTTKQSETNMADGHAGLKAYSKYSFIRWLETREHGKSSQAFEKCL